MLSQQILTKKVVDYLRENHSIRLNLPNLFRSIDSKVTLKYLKSFALGRNQNRYQILVTRIQQLLKKNLLNLDKIKLFSQDFFNTITEDILILQQNEKMRKKIPIAKQQILMKSHQITGFQQNIKTQCLLINDKQDVLNFISNSLKDYLTKLSIIANQYNNVNKLQILTSINIDDLYQDSITNQQDYVKHYNPLLQVLNKLKSNMIKLYQEIQSSDPYDVPLRCVNFLANCKNLIQQMEPFVLSNDCVFNRMIFFVVKCQKENLELVASNYQKALVFCRQITSDLFKGYFLGFMFKPTFVQIKQSLQSSRQSLLKLINDEQLPQLKLSQLLKAEIIKLQQVKQRTKQLKSIIIIGKSSIMKTHVSKKQCKKLSLIKQAKAEYITLKKMIEMFSKYYQMKKHVQKLQNKQIQQSSRIIKQVRMLQKINDIKQLVDDTKQKEKITPQRRFQATFLKLQQLMLQVSTLKNQLQLQLQSHHDQKSHQILLQYITHRVQKLSSINTNYLDLQTKLLNAFLTIQTQAQKLQQQSLLAKEQTLSTLQNYFEQKLNQNLGFMISNEDNFCQQIKAKIMDLGKAQYMIKEWKKDCVSDQAIVQASKKDEDQIKFYRNNLQWLLILFEGSMDQKIFQMMMDKLNFQSQDYAQKQKKVQQFITEINKYITDLKNLLKTHPLSQIHPKIFKIIKDRIQLYEIVNDIYTECLLVFRQIKSKDPQYNIENKGLLLFDQEVFRYVLMVYQFRNKLRMQMSELRQLMLPPRTRNYLIDQLYQPFAIRYGQYINFKQEQLLNFTLRLQHALNIQHSQKKIILLFQQLLQQPLSEQYFSNVQSLCKQLVQVNSQNQQVMQLQNQPVVIHNLPKFRQLILPYNQYYRLAEQIVKDIARDDIQLRATSKLQLKNARLTALRSVLVERWDQSHNQNANNINNNNSGSNYNDQKSNNYNDQKSNNYNDQKSNLSRVDSRMSRGSKYNKTQTNLISKLNSNQHQPNQQQY